jgi:hypothetical protein
MTDILYLSAMICLPICAYKTKNRVIRIVCIVLSFLLIVFAVLSTRWLYQ